MNYLPGGVLEEFSRTGKFGDTLETVKSHLNMNRDQSFLLAVLVSEGCELSDGAQRVRRDEVMKNLDEELVSSD